MEQRDTFDTVAEVYDSVRPGYPAPLFEAIGKTAGLQAGDPVLEIGCGSGQATASLLDRGWTVTALDSGPAMIAAAERRFAGRRDVSFVNARFEDWRPPAGAFRLVAAAQAWHWVPPAQAYAQTALALAPGGWLAIFAHVPVGYPESFLAAAQPVFARHAPEAWGPPPETGYLPQGPLLEQIEGSGRFGRPIHQAFPWTWRHTAESYAAFLESRSDTQLLPPQRRAPLIAGLRAAVEQQGDELVIGYESHLYLAQRN